MSSVVAVLVLIVTAINLTNYSSISTLLDEKLTMLVENDGLIPEVNFGPPPADPEPEKPTDPGTSGGEDDPSDDPTQPGEGDNNTEDDPADDVGYPVNAR